ncbi:MAG: hypothetical protein IKN80_08160 [Clostridiales bacterium]|nr:hypothetical protein [Clostridiales bacterium]
MFSERLDLLMRITDTSNSTLARALAFDPSYISKLRRGKRSVPKGKDLEDTAASFFAKRALTGTSRKVLSDVICPGQELPADADRSAQMIRDFLAEEDGAEGEAFNEFFAGLAGMEAKPEDSSVISGVKADGAGPGEAFFSGNEVDIFYGNEGKRAGVLRFLNEVSEGKVSGGKLLLYSDEDMRWMYESSSFAAEWAALLKAVIAKGISIKIIHTVQRDLNDMMEAIRKWMPLYITGRIEPYYCPRIRDDIYKRSLFVAPGLVALTSTSVGSSTEGMANIIFRGKEAVRSFELEFENYSACCKPLMKVYDMKSEDPRKEYLKLLSSGVTVRNVFRLDETDDHPGKTRAQINSVLKLMEQYPGYEPIITDKLPGNIEIISAQYGNSFITISPSMGFEIFEQSLSSAVYEYAGRIGGRSSREDAARRLKQAL